MSTIVKPRRRSGQPGPSETQPDKRRRTPTQARASRTRAALLEAARVEFAESGYASTTARSIAARAGAASGSFYQYFNDKDEVLLEIYEERAARLRSLAETRLSEVVLSPAPLPQSAREALEAVVNGVIRLHREDRGLHAVLTEREHADPRFREQARRAATAFVRVIEALLARLSYAGDPVARAFLIFNLVEGAVHAHVLGEGMVSDRRFKRDLLEALSTLAMPGERL